MDFFEKELRGMFEKHQLLKEQKYCGNVLLAKLDGELRVKLQFVTQGTAEKYTALAATVINRTDRNPRHCGKVHSACGNGHQ